MLRHIAALLTSVALCSSALAGQVSISIPGQSFNCAGSDMYFMFMQTCPSGPFPNASYPSALGCSSVPGGAPSGWTWPSSMTIWKASMTTITIDPNALSQIGILGAGGDLITPVMIGQGYMESNHLPNGRAFTSSTDRFDLHVQCVAGPGKTFSIQGSIEYTTP